MKVEIDILKVFDILGAVLVISGITFLNSKKASNPRIREYGSIIIIGCVLLAIVVFYLGVYGNMLTQIGVILGSIYGIFNCKKEIKKRKEGIKNG